MKPRNETFYLSSEDGSQGDGGGRGLHFNLQTNRASRSSLRLVHRQSWYMPNTFGASVTIAFPNPSSFNLNTAYEGLVCAAARMVHIHTSQ